MKFYTLTYDCNRPTKQQINVPTNSDFKVGVKIYKNDEEQILEPTEVTLGNLSADPEKTNGYVTFTQATGDEAKMEVSKISVDHIAPETKQARDIRKGQTTGVSLYINNNTELIGKNIVPGDIYFRYYIGSNSDTSATVNEALDAEPYNAFHVDGGIAPAVQVVAHKEDAPYDRSRQLVVPNGAWDSLFRAETKEGQLSICVNPEDLPPVGVDYFLGYVSIDEQTEKYKILLNYTLKEDDLFYYTRMATGRTYRGSDLKIQIGQPFNANFDLAVNTFKSQQGDIDDTNDFYTKDVMDEMLSSKADKSDVFAREQLSAMFTALKDTSTDAVKSIENITSADVVSCLYNIGAELFGTVQSEG